MWEILGKKFTRNKPANHNYNETSRWMVARKNATSVHQLQAITIRGTVSRFVNHTRWIIPRNSPPYNCRITTYPVRNPATQTTMSTPSPSITLIIRLFDFNPPLQTSLEHHIFFRLIFFTLVRRENRERFKDFLGFLDDNQEIIISFFVKKFNF